MGDAECQGHTALLRHYQGGEEQLSLCCQVSLFSLALLSTHIYVGLIDSYNWAIKT